MAGDPVGQLRRWRRRHGDVFVLRLPATGPIVVVGDPPTAAAVLHADPTTARAGEATGRLLAMLGPRCLLRLDGDTHAARRRLLNPAFHGPALERHRETITRIADREVAAWPTGETFPVLPAMRRVAFAVAAHLILGVDEPRRVDDLHRLVRAATGVAALPATWLWPLPPTRSPAWAHRPRRRAEAKLDRWLLDEIARRPSGGRGALGALMPGPASDPDRPLPGAARTPTDLLEELRALLVVGHETTAAALAWCVLRLAEDSGTARLADGGGPDLRRVVRDTLQQQPPVVDAVRRLTAPMPVADGLLPAGTLVLVAPALVHDRAATDGGGDGDAHSVAFGGGARRCLGASAARLEIEIVLERILTAVTLRRGPRHRRPAPLAGTVITPAGRKVTVAARPGPLA